MSWLSGWTYRKEITVTNANADYQTKILVGESSGATGEEVDCGGHCKTDFGDLRFTEDDGETLLKYNIDWGTLSGSTPNQLVEVWVKNNATPDTTLFLYYGNASATDASSGADTFLFFDDFSAGIDWDNKWASTDHNNFSIVSGWLRCSTRPSASTEYIHTKSTFNENAAVHFKWRVSNTSSFSAYMYWADGAAHYTYETAGTGYFPSGSTGHRVGYVDSSDVLQQSAGGWTTSLPKDILLVHYNGASDYVLSQASYDGGVELAITNTDPKVGVDRYFKFLNWGTTATSEITDVFICKYNTTEPSFAFGFEQEVDWVSPTGFVDPDSHWNDEANAYDENIATLAITDAGYAMSVEELSHAELSCDKIRILASFALDGTTELDYDLTLDAYYASDWHNIITDSPLTKGIWQEVALGSTLTITAARVKIEHQDGVSNSNSKSRLYEFDFHEVVITDYPISLSPGLTASATVAYLAAWDRATSPGLTASITITRALAWDRSTTSDLTVAVTIAKALGRLIAVSAGLTVSATVDKALTWTRATTSNLTTSVTIARQRARTILTTSNLTVSTTIARALGRIISTTSNLTISTAISKALAYTRASSSNLTISATVARRLASIKSISAGLTTAVSIARQFNRTILIDTGLTISTTIQRILGKLITTSSGLTIDVTITKAMAIYKTVIANLTASATVSRVLAYSKAITSNLAASVEVLWTPSRNLILKVTEGHVYRMIVTEGNAYRMKTIAGNVYRLVVTEGVIYRLKNIAGKIYRMITKEG